MFISFCVVCSSFFWGGLTLIKKHWAVRFIKLLVFCVQNFLQGRRPPQKKMCPSIHIFWCVVFIKVLGS